MEGDHEKMTRRPMVQREILPNLNEARRGPRRRIITIITSIHTITTTIISSRQRMVRVRSTLCDSRQILSHTPTPAIQHTTTIIITHILDTITIMRLALLRLHESRIPPS